MTTTPKQAAPAKATDRDVKDAAGADNPVNKDVTVKDATLIVGDPKDDTPAEGVTPEQQVEDSDKLVDKVLKMLEGHALQKGPAQRLINAIRSDHKI